MIERFFYSNAVQAAIMFGLAGLIWLLPMTPIGSMTATLGFAAVIGVLNWLSAREKRPDVAFEWTIPNAIYILAVGAFTISLMAFLIRVYWISGS